MLRHNWSLVGEAMHIERSRIMVKVTVVTQLRKVKTKGSETECAVPDSA